MFKLTNLTEDTLNLAPPELSEETDIRINGRTLHINFSDLIPERQLGNGSVGFVQQMLHGPSNYRFAVKSIVLTPGRISSSQIRRDLDVSRDTECPCLVMCYGGLISHSQVFIITELMDLSLEDLRTRVYHPCEAKLSTPASSIPESIIAYIVHRIVTGLEYLHSSRSMIHRDVKPSNMLVNRLGYVKLCDFGIVGDLKDSVARTFVGTHRYLAPERIRGLKGYRIQSDVWSLGLSIIELASGESCYSHLTSLSDLVQRVTSSEPPSLPADASYSDELHDFVNRCLVKDEGERANYIQLMETDFLHLVDIDRGRMELKNFLLPYLPDQY